MLLPAGPSRRVPTAYGVDKLPPIVDNSRTIVDKSARPAESGREISQGDGLRMFASGWAAALPVQRTSQKGSGDRR